MSTDTTDIGDTLFTARLEEIRELSRQICGHVINLTGSPTLEAESQLGGFYKQLSTINSNAASPTLTVAVLALAKSGKSTLLNALIGHDILPSNNVPETARVVRIIHDPTLPQGLLTETRTALHAQPELMVTTRGVDEIRTRLAELNSRHREHPSGSRGSHVEDVELEIRIAVEALMGIGQQHALDQQHTQHGDDKEEASCGDEKTKEPREGNEDTQDQNEGPRKEKEERHTAPQQQGPITLELVDTPGPNEAGEARLKDKVERLLSAKADAVLYVLDYTKLKTAEEASILARLKEINPALVQRLCSRLFFVVNKLDVRKKEVGLDEGATREYVAQLITQQMSMAEFQLQPEQVLLVSARDALLSRLVLNNHASPEDRKKLIGSAFGWYRLSQPTEAMVMEAAGQMLIHSGVPQLESSVLRFLFTTAGTLKLQSLADSISSLLAQLSNVHQTHQGALKEDRMTLADKTAAIQKQLHVVLERFDEVQDRAMDIHGLVTDGLRERMQHLKEHLHTRVSVALEPYDAPEPQGRWSRVWHAARSVFSSGRSENRAEIEHNLRQLVDAVTSEFASEARDFWQTTEVLANEQQRVLFAALNKHIRELATAIESTIDVALDVQLNPVDLSIHPPDAEQFHLDLQALLAAGMVQHTREENVHIDRRPCNNSLCGMSGFFGGGGCERCRAQQYTRLVAEYEVAPARVQEFFVRGIDEAIDKSCRAVRTFVGQFVQAQVASARAQLTSYSELFSSTMLQALDTLERGEEARTAELQRLTQALAAIRTLQQRVDQLLQDLVPTVDHGVDHDVDHGVDHDVVPQLKLIYDGTEWPLHKQTGCSDLVPDLGLIDARMVQNPMGVSADKEEDDSVSTMVNELVNAVVGQHDTQAPSADADLYLVHHDDNEGVNHENEGVNHGENNEEITMIELKTSIVPPSALTPDTPLVLTPDTPQRDTLTFPTTTTATFSLTKPTPPPAAFNCRTFEVHMEQMLQELNQQAIEDASEVALIEATPMDTNVHEGPLLMTPVYDQPGPTTSKGPPSDPGREGWASEGSSQDWHMVDGEVEVIDMNVGKH